MIPKKIHYCWFGRGPKPQSALDCIASWKKYLPDYEIVEWNEDNFDVNQTDYCSQAYKLGKYAFVSDYARFKILFEQGGVYFDTDVEVVKPMESVIERGPFMGIERTHYGVSGVNPGLGFAAEAGMPILQEILSFYENHDFSLQYGTIVTITTGALLNYGLQMTDTEQFVAGFIIYPTEVLCPLDSTTGVIKLTEKTISIHHYSCSWINQKTFRFKLHLLKNFINRMLGEKFGLWLASLIKKH